MHNRRDNFHSESRKIPRPKKRYLMLRLCKYFVQHPFLVLAAIALTVGSNLLALVGPSLSGKAIDAIQPGPGACRVSAGFLLLWADDPFYAGSSLLSYILSALMINLSQKIIYQMRKEVFNNLLDLPVNYFDQHQTGRYPQPAVL